MYKETHHGTVFRHFGEVLILKADILIAVVLSGITSVKFVSVNTIPSGTKVKDLVITSISCTWHFNHLILTKKLISVPNEDFEDITKMKFGVILV